MVQGRTEQQFLTSMSKVIEGLRGNALVVAQEIGLTKLQTEGDTVSTGGMELLLSEMKKSGIPTYRT